MRIFRSWTFSWREMGALKISLISLGILCQIYFSEYLTGLEWLWWVLFAVPALYFVMRVFREE